MEEEYSEIKEKYLELLNSGYMFDFYPFLTGNYRKDRKEWLPIYTKIKRMERNILIKERIKEKWNIVL